MPNIIQLDHSSMEVLKDIRKKYADTPTEKFSEAYEDIRKKLPNFKLKFAIFVPTFAAFLNVPIDAFADDGIAIDEFQSYFDTVTEKLMFLVFIFIITSTLANILMNIFEEDLEKIKDSLLKGAFSAALVPVIFELFKIVKNYWL